jgi:oligosaccharide repeat unit polymerase
MALHEIGNFRRIMVYKRVFINPFFIFLITWMVTLFLYNLKFSDLLLYDGYNLFLPIVVIIVSFAIGAIFAYISKRGVNRGVCTLLLIPNSALIKIELRLRWLLIFWFSMTLIEIIYSSGVPLYWLATGSDKTYFDFGLPSLHGLLNSVILASSLVSYFLSKHSSFKVYIIVPWFITFWGVIVVSRNLIIVNFIQIIFLYLITNPPLKIRYFIMGVPALMAIVLGFGWLGDARSGADSFIELALPSSDYPNFLPSGVLWIYIYITTPLNNLVHQILNVNPEWNWGLINAFSLLLPSVIRNLFYDSKDFFKGDLVSEAFNVSTAYLDIYKDIGFFGVFLLSLLVGYVSMKIWVGNRLKAIFSFSIISQCNVLSIFFNHYFYLPIIFQFIVVAFILGANGKLQIANDKCQMSKG